MMAKQIRVNGKIHSFPDEATEEEINATLGGAQPSLAHSYKDYLQGLGVGGLQKASNLGASIAQAPSDIYSYFTGKEGYKAPRPNLDEFVPESNAGQTGKHVGETVGDISELIFGGRAGSRAFQALTRYHPLTKGQMGRQIQRPIDAAERAGVRAPLSAREAYELDQLLSHPALEAGGSTGRALTPMGRAAIVEGAVQGRGSALHSAQANLGHLERAIPGMGESELANTRVRPLKENILEGYQQAMRESGLTEEANNLREAREAARRYYRTRKSLKNIGKTVGKPLSLGAIIKTALSGVKGLP